jgi:hypothetical protein
MRRTQSYHAFGKWVEESRRTIPAGNAWDSRPSIWGPFTHTSFYSELKFACLARLAQELILLFAEKGRQGSTRWRG